MNVAQPYAPREEPAVLANLRWLAELGQKPLHDLFLMACGGEVSRGIVEAARAVFASVQIVKDYEGVTSDWHKGGPIGRSAAGPNSAMRQMAWHFHQLNRGPWFFWESDAVPLCADWLERLEAEYHAAGKPFLNALVPEQGGTKAHATGNGIYPSDTIIRVMGIALPHTASDNPAAEIAFDIAAADEILPHSHHSRLIQHVFYWPEYPQVPTFEDHASLSLISREAVIFHRCKGPSLIERLRELKSGLAGESRHSVETETGTVTMYERSFPVFRVHTYFAPVESADGRAEQERLLALWASSWREQGWEPVVLTEDDARKHPSYDSLKAKFAQMSTVNPSVYEMACWLRWVAMACRGGVLTDYDTINLGFTPDDLPKFAEDKAGFVPFLLADHVPCAVAGSADSYFHAAACFAAATERFTENGRPHVSDMLLVEKWGWPSRSDCVEYGTPGWESAKLVHFGHYSTNFKRSEVIAGVLKARKDVASVGSLPSTASTLTTADCIAALVAFSKKDGFAKGRIVKQLRSAGLIPAKKK